MLWMGTNVFRRCLLIPARTFKSAQALDILYPNSCLKITTPSFAPEDPNAKFSGYIPISKLDITYSCSSGPGGQNVNKVHTKVDLRFKIAEADWLDSSVREKLAEMQKNALTKEGYLVIRSDLTRSQHLNLADCMKKLRDLIRKAAEPPKEVLPEIKEIIIKRKEKAARERLLVKRHSSMRRQLKEAPTVRDL